MILIPQRFQELVCNFPWVVLLCPSPTACFPIVISSKARKRRERSVGVRGELQERGKLGSLHLVGGQFGGWGTRTVGQGGSSLAAEQKVVAWLRSERVSGPLSFL